MDKNTKDIMIKNNIKMMELLSDKIQEKLSFANEGLSKNNTNKIVGSISGLDEILEQIKSFYSTTITLARL